MWHLAKVYKLVSPDTFSGDRNWTDWVDHFEVAATVNGWDEPTKLLWRGCQFDLRERR